MTSVDQCASFGPWEGPTPTPGHIFEVLGLIGRGDMYACRRVILKSRAVPGTYKVYRAHILRERKKMN